MALTRPRRHAQRWMTVQCHMGVAAEHGLVRALGAASWSVSGILYAPECAVAIHLCGLPEGYLTTEAAWWTSRPSPLLGLAPNGVYRAVPVARHAGALLPHRCTLTCERLPVPSAVSLCCTVREVTPTWLAPAFCSAESRLSSMPYCPKTASTPRPPGQLAARRVYGSARAKLSSRSGSRRRTSSGSASRC
jgi:hypothetical protein